MVDGQHPVHRPVQTCCGEKCRKEDLGIGITVLRAAELKAELAKKGENKEMIEKAEAELWRDFIGGYEDDGTADQESRMNRKEHMDAAHNQREENLSRDYSE